MALGKSTQLKALSLLALFLYLSGCAQGHCRRLERKATTELEKNEAAIPVNTRQLKVYKRRVLVFKYDETQQCEVWKGISLEKMEKELSPIQVLSKQKKHDGYERIQVCGASTGQANVFEIYEDDLEMALQKGFKLWKFQ